MSKSMIKTFISHVSENDSFVNRLEDKLKKENYNLDIFVDHHKNRCGDDLQKMIEEVKKSIIFLPILTKESLSCSKVFFINEIKTAFATSTVNIFPITINVKVEDIPDSIGIKEYFEKCDRVKGKIWIDFEREWELKYQKLREAIFHRLRELDILKKDDNFYQDVEHIDIILKRQNPTPSEIKTMVDVYLLKESYQIYFFEHLEKIEWLQYLYHSRVFISNPEPITKPEQAGNYTTPYWIALNYLEKLSQRITEETEERHGNRIMEIIRIHSQYDANGKRVENYLTDWAFIKIISNLPQKYITIEDILLISNYFNITGEKTLLSSEISKSLFPKLIKTGEKEKAIKLLEIAINNKLSGEKPIPLMEDYWLNELIEKNKSGICNLFPLEAAEIIINKISQIDSHKENEFNNVWIPAIEDHPQNSFPDRYQNVLVRATRDFISYAIKEKSDDAKELIVNLLKKNHSIFKRLAIYFISTNWDKYSTLFWKCFGKNIFDDISLKHEVYHLLKNNFELFTDKQKNSIIDWIENCDYGLAEIYEASIKQNWLHSIKDSKFKKAKERYNYYKNITDVEPEHPDFSYWMEGGGVQVGGISPINVDELIKKPNIEISCYLKEYKDSGVWFNQPSIEGLGEALREAVKRNPEKFISDINVFLEIQQNYQSEILSGLLEAWKNNKEFEWNPVLNFCQQIINNGDFWSCNCAKDEPNYRDLIISRIANLIEEGTRDDGHAYDAVHLPLTEEIIFNILPKIESDIKYLDDLSMSVVNSAKGQIFMAAIVYSLRYARLNRESLGPTLWPIRMKDEFTKRLNKNFDESLEFSFILGKYLPNLIYLDKKWVEENLSRIFPIENEDHWKAAMEGYLLTKVHIDIYHLIKNGGHYRNALRTDFSNEEVRKRIIQHICIGFLNGMEDLTNHENLFSIMLEDWKTKEVSEMISFFWMLRKSEKLSDDQRGKILLFWETVFDHYKDEKDLSAEDKTILSSCSQLAVFLDIINEKYLEWLKLSARFLAHSFNPFFIEYLDRLVKVSPHEVGLVYNEILENNTYPIYKQEDIMSLIQGLYNSGEKETADKICNLYHSKGYNFLREIYDKNKSPITSAMLK